MRTASTAFKEKLKSSSRNFINTAVITLKSQVELTVTNANILFSGLEIEDSVGSDTTFNALGSTIINKCTLTLYNGDEAYSEYDFEGAHVAVYTALDIDNTIETIQLGVYTIDEANYTTSSIVLSMLDNMSKFDISYSESQLTYPATLGDIVTEACLRCGVTFNSAGSDFVYDTFIVDAPPNSSVCTFRDVIGWAATINGTFARCNSLGQLEFKWFDLSGRPIPTDNITVIDENNVEHEHASLVLSEGTVVDTISYLPGKNTSLPEVSSLFSQDIAVSDITITGVTITVANIEDEADTTVSVGTDDYRITISDNPFITADNIETVIEQIANKVLDLSFRKCSVTCVSNPLLEAGDTAYLIDTKGNEHRILLTRVTFSPTANQTIVCGADTPSRKSATLYNADTRTSAQLKSHLRSLRERLVETETIAGNTNQYFWFTEEGTDTGAHITEVPQEEFTDQTSENYHAGYNALFRSIGFAIRNGLTELATFGTSAITLGLANAKHILIDTNGISLYSAASTLLSNFTASGVNLYVQGILRTALSNTGLVIYDTDGSTPVASFGTTSTIGKQNSAHLEQTSGGLRIVDADNNNNVTMGAQSSTTTWTEETFIVSGASIDEETGTVTNGELEINLPIELASGQNMTLTIDTAYTIPVGTTYNYDGTDYIIVYDGDYTVAVANKSTSDITVTLRYPVAQPANYGIIATTPDATRIKARAYSNEQVIAEGGIYANDAGNFGLYDTKRTSWMMVSTADGTVKIPSLKPQLLYAKKVVVPSQQSAWNYIDIQLSQWAVIAVRASVHNVRQYLLFFSSTSGTSQNISDTPSQSLYIRGQFMAKWDTNRIYVRWVNGTASTYQTVYFDQVIGLVRK